MSIFLLLRVYAASFFHKSGWAGLAIALASHIATACLGELARLIGQQPSINPPGATRVPGGEHVYIPSTRLKEITHGMV
ncbi:hypothetical protein HK44_017240 [Pseudomonas fluorescens HK44]|uniref:Uncharacterized protein n=1 Tax=Pseudomonas fluorescens HK44 TaxID=1042209 RepID=A0A010RRS4_PSEFL|nr:hypothetical protein [Pseudomonas fluorescens]EXF91689.1 hypothetical protein HK44_017240 [Pseudomonas fluorescens HK44]